MLRSVGLDLEKGWIKVVEISSDLKLTNIGRIRIPRSDKEDTRNEQELYAAKINELFSNLKIARENVVSNIRGSYILARTYLPPSKDKDEFERWFVKSIESIIPGTPIEDVVYSYELLPSGRALIAFARRTEIEKQLEMLKTCTIVPVLIDASCLALYDAFSPHPWIQKKENVAILDIGTYSTGVLIIKDGEAFGSNAISLGGKDLIKGKDRANKIESIIFLESPISQPDTLSISAKVVKFEVINSTLAAEFNTGNPAAVTNEYGDGRAVFFGFDMTDVESGIEKYLVNAITYTTPDTSGVYPGATIPVEISIKNLSPEQRLNVVEVVPENFIIIAALDSGIISGPTITWNFPILQDSTVYLNSIIKLPNQEFTDTISAEISYLSEGNYVPYDTLYLEISTISRRITPSPSMGEGKGEGVKSYPLTPERLIDKIIKEFNSISYEHMPRDSIYEVLHRLKEAKNLLNLKSKAIEHLLYVAQRIKHIPEFADLRKKIDFVINLLYNNQEK
jgi:hypothetical protein